ncbi:unnamed protein product [Chilo suppressalis]|uniref:phytanoyl-CoA dioxygenase n=1 Tax=Chilo suppressalis TaxID=168631 RepID=A0ABN8L544_CHISP|nr:unnamed protein product [Chilo suppressalis]
MDKLSPEQIKFYHDKGYLVIGQLIDFESLYTYKKRFLQICNGLVPKGTMTIAKEPKLKESSNNPEDYVNKDLYYFPFRPADKIIASWTAIDVVTYENGCLYVVPGSHKQQKLYAHDYTSIDNKMYHGILDPTAALETDRVHLEMNPGDTVFFHPYLIHGSRPNVSKNYRKSISCHFASSDVTYIDVQGTVQDVIAKEVVQEAKRRGFEASFADVWKYKSVPIKPIKSHL